MSWLLTLLTGPLVNQVVNLIRSYQDRKMSEAELEAEVRKAMLATYAEIAQTQGEVIMAEARGDSWLQRNWRPIVGLAFASVPFFYAIILPIAVDWIGAPPVRVGDLLLGWIMNATVIALGGYVARNAVVDGVKAWRGMK